LAVLRGQPTLGRDLDASKYTRISPKYHPQA
jgi:hypothetical protein